MKRYFVLILFFVGSSCFEELFDCENEECMQLKDEGSEMKGTTTCDPSKFHCGNGECIDWSLHCDNKKDCANGRDEVLCPRVSPSNRTWSIKCRPLPEGQGCYCEDGYKLSTESNETCTDIDECSENGFCSQICNNLPGSHECSCLDGYELVNRTCRASGSEPLLIFSELEELHAISLRSMRKFSLQKAISKSCAIDTDYLESKIYWTEIARNSSIYSSNMNGSGIQLVLHNGLMIPEDIAVDSIARNLYITDSGLKQILVCKIDGSMCHVLHNSNLDKPRSIVLDLRQGLVYWSDWGEETSGIYYSGMDGSHRLTLVSTSIKWPNGIAIDQTTNRLYWVDGFLGKIEYISLDDKTRKVLIEGVIHHPYSLEVFEDNLYWSEFGSFSLISCNKFTGHGKTVMTKQIRKHIMGVHVYHPVLAMRSNNPCLDNPCSHMCLITPLGGYSCACPLGFNISADGWKCMVDSNFPILFVNDMSRVYHLRPEAVGNASMDELSVTQIDRIGRLAYDWKSKYLYVSDTNKSAIYAVNTTTMITKELIRSDSLMAEDMALDSLNGVLYWLDSSKGTVEVVSTKTYKTATIVEGLTEPTSLVLVPSTGIMFISANGENSSLFMYDLDGTNRRSFDAVKGNISALAVHPTLRLLYFADSVNKTISSIYYRNNGSHPTVVRENVSCVMSIAVSDKYVYWTDYCKCRLNFQHHSSDFYHFISLPGSESDCAYLKVIYAAEPVKIDHVSCMSNYECGLCLSSTKGVSCLCPMGRKLDTDNRTCLDTRTMCLIYDFRCQNGNCVSSSWKCDGTDDCGDGSDEIACPLPTCTHSQFLCAADAACIPRLWQCDGERDCNDNSDEIHCNSTSCDPQSQYRCDQGQCLPKQWACDGTNDCIDGSDETNCNTTTCDPSKFHCGNGECIDWSLHCDKKKDCVNGRDEVLCPNTTTCDPSKFHCGNGECIDWSLHCDKKKDCANGRDEVLCSTEIRKCNFGEFQCGNKNCISWKLVCDKKKDCKDGSDEKHCSLTKTVCSSREFQCDNKTCIKRTLVCDKKKDCADGSDEENCTPTKIICGPGEFQCGNETCINQTLVCDNKRDCADGLDEENCTPTKIICNPGQFQCGNEACINRTLVCDNKRDCADGLDEKNCSTQTICKEYFYACKDGATCIYNHEVCDGHIDCPMGEDEKNCTVSCKAEEYYCTNNSRCIPKLWLCDGDKDCSDGADETHENCTRHVPGCEGFLCGIPTKCIFWSKVCDGVNDCEDWTDEGSMCANACSGERGGCSQVCHKTPQGSKCSCNSGYSLAEDGVNCEDVNECDIPGRCSQFCNNTKGGFKCSCAEGYVLDVFRKCKAVGGPATLVYMLPDQIVGIDFATHSEHIYVADATRDIRGMDYDASDRIYFWSDWKEETINSYQPSTGSRNVVLTTFQTRPVLVRWDWITKNLYYTDDMHIISCSQNGTHCRTLLYNGRYVNSFVLAPIKGMMFWSTWVTDDRTGYIERAEMDGSRRMVIVSEKTIWPSALTVDHVMEVIYWTDMKLNVIECSDFYGLKRRVLVDDPLQLLPKSMTLFEDYLYINNWATGSIIRCNKHSGRNCMEFHKGNINTEVLLIAQEVTQPKGENRCLDNTCSQLCLPTRVGHVCKCDDNYKLINDTCELKIKL